MKLNIHQCYYDNSQVGELSPEFIPYDNIGDENYMFREYVLWKKLYRKHLNDGSHWGIVSWRWPEKTRLQAKEFVDWIENNPGYDMYYFDPSLETIVHKNLWTQGDPWHPGLNNFCNHLLEKLNTNLTVEDLNYRSKHFACSSFFIGNSKFWTDYLSFVNEVITISLFDKEMKQYLFDTKQQYNGVDIPFFCFVVERLFSLYYYLNEDKCNFLKFPVEHECYKNKHGNNYTTFLEIYKSKE